MSEVANTGGAVDRRPDVVGLVAQLDFSGVQPNAQPDRRQRRALQIERACDRVTRASEGDDEAVALTLFEGRTPPWAPTTSAACGQEQRRRRSSRRPGSPQPRRAFDVASNNDTVPVGTSSLTPRSLSSARPRQFRSC